MKPSLRLLALLVGIALSLGGLAFAGVQIKQHREEQAAAAKVAAAAKAVADYQHAVLPVLENVFDVVQPLLDLADLHYPEDQPELTVIQGDVFTRTRVSAVLQEQAAVLRSVHVPPQFTLVHQEMTVRLDSLLPMSEALAAATLAVPNRDGWVMPMVYALRRLEATSFDWQLVTHKVFGEIKVPVPAPRRERANGRVPRSRVSFVLQSDLLCGRARADFSAGYNRAHTEEAWEGEMARWADLTRVEVAGLAKVRTSPADGAQLRHIRKGLKAAGTLASALDDVVAAHQADDASDMAAARHRMDRLGPRLHELSVAYKGYGARLCSLEFDAPSSSGAAPHAA